MLLFVVYTLRLIYFLLPFTLDWRSFFLYHFSNGGNKASMHDPLLTWNVTNKLFWGRSICSQSDCVRRLQNIPLIYRWICHKFREQFEHFQGKNAIFHEITKNFHIISSFIELKCIMRFLYTYFNRNFFREKRQFAWSVCILRSMSFSFHLNRWIFLTCCWYKKQCKRPILRSPRESMRSLS